MTRWTEHIRSEAEKRKTAYGCAMSMPEVIYSYFDKYPDAIARSKSKWKNEYLKKKKNIKEMKDVVKVVKKGVDSINEMFDEKLEELKQKEIKPPKGFYEKIKAFKEKKASRVKETKTNTATPLPIPANQPQETTEQRRRRMNRENMRRRREDARRVKEGLAPLLPPARPRNR